MAAQSLPEIVAPVIPAFLMLHTMSWWVALAGATVPVNVSGAPAVVAAGTSVMSVTGTNCACKVAVSVSAAVSAAVMREVIFM